MRFLIGDLVQPEADVVFTLFKDNWNDWFVWHTMYSVIAVKPDGQKVQLGSVKIGCKGMTGDANGGSPPISASFPFLDDNFFSLGQSENYYETLETLGEDVRRRYTQCPRVTQSPPSVELSLKDFTANR